MFLPRNARWAVVVVLVLGVVVAVLMLVLVVLVVVAVLVVAWVPLLSVVWGPFSAVSTCEPRSCSWFVACDGSSQRSQNSFFKIGVQDLIFSRFSSPKVRCSSWI